MIPLFVKTLLSLLLCASVLRAEDAGLDALSAGNALGGKEVYDIVKNAQTVTAQRIDSTLADTKELAERHPELIILGEPFDVPATEAEALKKIFTTGSTYLSPSKSCAFRANVRYGFFIPPDRRTEIVLCFGCGEMEVWNNGRMASFGPFDGAYGKILEITKRLFSKDEFLAAFTEDAFKERAARLRVQKP